MGILATLMMAASQTDDFPLDEQVPIVGGFRYMEHADSFRKSLIQIGHESYRAFLSAHNNMNKIRLSTLTIPDYIKAAVDILATGDVQLIQQHLHRPLSVVKKSIDDNVNWSMEVAVAFDQLSNLTDEVHLAAVSSNNVKLVQKLELKAKQTSGQLTADLLHQSLDNLAKQTTLDLEKYSQNLNDLLDAHLSIPLAIDRLWMDVAEAIADKVIGIKTNIGLLNFVIFNLNLTMFCDHSGNALKLVKTVATFRNHFAGPSQEISPNQFENNTTLPSRDPCINRHYYAIFTISARSATLERNYQTLLSINSANGRYNATKDTAFYKDLLTNTTECGPVKEIIETGLETIELIHQLAHADQMPHQLRNQSADEKSQFKEWRNSEFILVRKSMEDFNAEAKRLENVALKVQKTEIRAGNVTLPGLKSWASEQAEANAYYKIALHEETARVLRSALELHWKQIIDKTDESIRILNEIHSWKAEELGLEQALEMLEAGMKEMNQLKVNWALLVRFFLQMSQMMKTMGSNSVEDFMIHLKTTVDTQSFERNNGQLKGWVIKTIQEKTIKANQAMNFVHDMASTYSRISSEYLMPRVQTLDQMMNFQTRNSTEMFSDRNELLESCTNDAFKIQQLIAEEKRRLMEKVDTRNTQIRNEYAFLDQLEGNHVNTNPNYYDVSNIDVNEFA